MEGDNFCTACGAELQPGSNFCPQCGRSLNGGASPQGFNITMSTLPVNPPGSFMILIWGILALIGGITTAVMFFTMSEDVFDEYVSLLGDYGMSTSVTYDDMWYYGAAYLFIVASGVLAIGSYMYCRKKTQWKPAVYLCAASSAVCLGTCIFGTVDGALYFIIGLLVTYTLYRGRAVFDDGKTGQEPPRGPWNRLPEDNPPSSVGASRPRHLF